VKFSTIFIICALAQAQTINYSYDSAGRLTAIRYPDGKTVAYNYDASGNMLRRTVGRAIEGPAPVISAAGLVNAASFKGGSVAPGEIVTIFGTGIGPGTLAGLQLTPGNFVDTIAGDTLVLFDEVPAAMIYASSGQTSFIVPYSVAPPSAQMVVVYQGRRSNAVTIPVAATAPGLFASNAQGSGNGAILNSDFTVNSPQNAAAKGSFVVLFGTGEGQTDPAGVVGRVANPVIPKPLLPVRVTIGGVEAEVLYAGAAPGLVTGLLQVNVVVPQSAPSGSAEVIVTVGNASSQTGLTVAVR
jgi:uncharacterized protein (TIGR03437 family)